MRPTLLISARSQIAYTLRDRCAVAAAFCNLLSKVQLTLGEWIRFQIGDDRPMELTNYIMDAYIARRLIVDSIQSPFFFAEN